MTNWDEIIAKQRAIQGDAAIKLISEVAAFTETLTPFDLDELERETERKRDAQR